MNEMPSQPSAPDKFHKRRHAKILLAIAALEVVAIAALLVWVIVFRPGRAPVTTAPVTSKPVVQAPLKPPSVVASQYASGFSAPVLITAMPTVTDKRLFVVEQPGTVKIVNADKTVDPTPFLDISSKITYGGEMGLLGLAFHPQVADNGYFYVNYIDKGEYTIIARYTISKQTGRADPTTEKVLLKIKQPYENHNGGMLLFGPDKYLYALLGDGGNGSDPQNHAQNTGDLLGKMLRIDVDNGDPYAIPATNPLGKGEGRQEIWAYGLRNPWRVSFDRKTGDLYIADVGQTMYEEVDFQKAGSAGGQNYGWHCYEGFHTLITDGCKAASNYTAPVLEYDHSEKRCSITGGYVYRGAKYPAMYGKYFYADYCGGQIYYTNESAGWKPTLAVATSANISTFGEDSSGELYIADHTTGAIYHLEDTAN